VLQGPIELGQYTSHDHVQVLDDHDVLQSIGTVGDALDNAMAESFVDSFKTELPRPRLADADRLGVRDRRVPRLV